MDGISVKKLAKNSGIPIKELMKQLQKLGIDVDDVDYLVSGKEQLELYQFLNSQGNSPKSNEEIKIDDIKAAQSLSLLNSLLTRAMAKHKHNELIKDDNLDLVIRKVIALNVEREGELQAAAILGRIAAVSRGRESQVFRCANQIFSKEPKSLETLEDSDAKDYAAEVISYCSNPWVKKYSYREAYIIDRANKARRKLLAANLAREKTLEDWLHELTSQSNTIGNIDKAETRFRRINDVTSALRDLTKTWRGNLGDDPGGQLSILMKSIFGRDLPDSEFDNIVESLDSLLSILQRCIELRFSIALYPNLYTIFVDGKRALATGFWGRYLEHSDKVSELQYALLEATLVLARQDKFDNDMMDVLRSAFRSHSRMTRAIKKHFVDAKDLDPIVADWWRNGGVGDSDKEQKAQRIRNSEDEKIGELLLKVEESRSVMEKLSSAVLPILQTLNPVLAKTVAKAASDYKETTLVVRSLSRMRQLEPAGLMSERMEYNLRRHDMEGGHRSGVRRVRVIRDGVEKTFAGKTRMIVKPIVIPEE